MAKKLTYLVSLLFLVFLPICVFVYEIVLPSWSLSLWQGFLLLITTILIAVVLFSLAVQFTVVFPLKDFKQNLERAWKEKKIIFSSKRLPVELRGVGETFSSIVGEIESKTATLRKTGELDELKSEFVTIASHQLRTPLTEIKWAVDLLSESPKTKSDESLQKLVGGARDAVGKITAIVAELLSVAEMSILEVDKRTGPIDLEEIILSAIKENRVLAASQHITIDVQKGEGFIPKIVGDADLFRFIFINLIRNAVSYGFANKPVVIRTRSLDKSVEVSVENEGVSLAGNEKSMLFEKFWRGAEAKRTHPDGSGLALYLTKRIIERYGGTVVYDAPRADKNIFSVRLPVGASGEVQTFITKY
ncbi:MAG: hypothetical protein A3D56_01905 [Candidatus Taylorbacteria bacterium RIFCSPHIGHO2_02_FULL_45_35]|uniref:histidine kinase n=1 Tax=Candidatus Taylorbacteria bacterium RIFCSPHIGHO2_02_FULL_45_35 TaxID=1802311 RepID=A0A1G2MV89_9BACT|nr:MAG: hypothetical protein A3D56_01905 [Candidatus Taylorbacteria bacterium RIFCSPHIGHO2_02_FULL_45_35]